MQVRQAKAAGDSSDQTLHAPTVQVADSALAPTAVRNPCSLKRVTVQVTVPGRTYNSTSCASSTSLCFECSLTWRPQPVAKPLSHNRDILLSQFVTGGQSLFLHLRTLLA